MHLQEMQKLNLIKMSDNNLEQMFSMVLVFTLIWTVGIEKNEI